MEVQNYISLTNLSTFLNGLRETFATTSALNTKQDAITGTEGQVVQINSDGEAVASNLELIAVEDIDTICGGAISYAEDVVF